jgi:hypothetical protein
LRGSHRDRPNCCSFAARTSYNDIATAVSVQPGSVGTLLARAREAFREEYLKQYGDPNVISPRGRHLD